MLEKTLSTLPGFPHRSSGCQELATSVRMLQALERFDATATSSYMSYTGNRVTQRDPVDISNMSTKTKAPSRRTMSTAVLAALEGIGGWLESLPSDTLASQLSRLDPVQLTMGERRSRFTGSMVSWPQGVGASRD
jgi:hypothetical protein